MISAITQFQARWYQWIQLLSWVCLGIIAVSLAAGKVNYVGEAWLLAAMAHILADFGLQNDWMSMGKAQREFVPLTLHCLISGILPAVVIGAPLPLIILSFAIHFAVDYLGKARVGGLLGDQSIHLGTYALICLALYW